MVSFSEKKDAPSPARKNTVTSVSKVSSSGTFASKHQEKDEALHIGQKVILMDSDCHGIITSLGKVVQIRLDDGLEIEASYGEFAVIDYSERAALRQAKVKTSKHSSSAGTAQCKSRAGYNLTVDLHIEAIPEGRNIPKGQQLNFQLGTFRRIIRTNLKHRGMKITFIHGIGDGILKAAIRKELDEVLTLRCTYNPTDPATTTVTIK